LDHSAKNRVDVDLKTIGHMREKSQENPVAAVPSRSCTAIPVDFVVVLFFFTVVAIVARQTAQSSAQRQRG
jgi:hypothetical protein